MGMKAEHKGMEKPAKQYCLMLAQSKISIRTNDLSTSTAFEFYQRILIQTSVQKEYIFILFLLSTNINQVIKNTEYHSNGKAKEESKNVDHLRVLRTELGNVNLVSNIKNALTNFNAIYGDMYGVKPNSTRSPVGTVGAIRVSPDKHVFTRPVKTNALRNVPPFTN